MNNTKQLDVLVVYSGKTAASASLSPYTNSKPFIDLSGQANYNSAYEYFLERCENQGITAGLSTTTDLIGQGTCKSYWVFENKNWEKVNNSCYSSNIFDKFSYKNKSLKTAQSLCFSSNDVRPFNSQYLKKLFSDKLLTYKNLPEFTIPTVKLVTDTTDEISECLKELKKLVNNHPHKEDFSPTVIMKDRMGAEGNHIYKIDRPTTKKIIAVLKKCPGISFIIQPFVHFDKGFSYKNTFAATDIRLVYQNGAIIQTYIRMAKKGDFRCNQHQGGTLIYTDITDIPTKILNLSQKVISQLGEKNKNALFALDYLISNSGTVYLLEGNSNPGIIWNQGYKKDEQMAKQIIRGIVKEFGRRLEG